MVMIAQERRKKNWTQKQLAEMIGVANSTLNQWETGLRRPNIDMLIRLTEIFGCTADELLGINRSSRNEEELVSGRSELLGISRGQEKKEEGAE